MVLVQPQPFLLAFFLLTHSVFADWPQAAGPNHNYEVDGSAPTDFSVTRGKNVLWKTPLPNTGESTPVVKNDRIFLTCHTPMKADGESGKEIFGMCFDAVTGKELWRRELPASRTTDMASGFSDNTAASPVTDGKYVCFINVGGSIQTFDYEGKLIWQQEWVPFGRHHARQQEPILHDGKVIFLRTVANDLPVSATTKAGAKPLGRDKKYWTRLHAVDPATGKLEWIAQAGTSVHSASLLSKTEDGTPAVLTGRGGGHQPPEEPYGLSLIRVNDGETIWDLPITKYAAHQNEVWEGSRGAAFVGMSHHLVDINSGKLGPGISLTENVQLRKYDGARYITEKNASLPTGKKKKAITYHTNCIAGDYHYFRTHTGFYIGRVHLKTNKIEYLQVPVQVDRNNKADVMLWDKAIANDVKNKDGFIVYQDKRATLHGWGHVSAASPLVVGDHLYMPTMIGTVYILRWNAAVLDENAQVSISDLGPSGKTWTLSSLAYADGKIYARTLKELICIGEEQIPRP